MPTGRSASALPPTSSSAAAPTSATIWTPTPPSPNAKRPKTSTASRRTTASCSSVLAYCPRKGRTTAAATAHQRVRWWSALALLRCLASSPAAAAATLRARSVTAEAETPDADESAGERLVLDLEDADADEFVDITPGSQDEDDRPAGRTSAAAGAGAQGRQLCGRTRRQAQEGSSSWSRAAERRLPPDRLLPLHPHRRIRRRRAAQGAAQGCRSRLPSPACCRPPSARQRVDQLGEAAQPCAGLHRLPERRHQPAGHFDAVLHYDLSWNPTRHEQREGRVDRYGQPSPKVRVLTYYGVDNQIDGVVLDVLLRKHKTIRSSLGISVPVPARTNEVVQALMQGLMLRGKSIAPGGQLSFMDESDSFGAAMLAEFNTQWDNATDKEKQSRSLFAQATIDVQEVGHEWADMQAAIGAGIDVARFFTQAVKLYGGFVASTGEVTELTLPSDLALKQAIGVDGPHTRTRFELPVPDGVTYLSRTTPAVEGLASYLVDSALDPLLQGKAARCGAIRTTAVTTRTTLLLLRLRHHIVAVRRTGQEPLLAEECITAGFRRRAGRSSLAS